MTGKRYYLTTLRAWQRHADRLSNSHWFAVPSTSIAISQPASTSQGEEASEQPILLLVEGDEGAHLALEDDPVFEALPHPLAQTPVSKNARTALASLSLPSDATTFDVAEAASRFHPLLRHHAF